MEVFPPAVIPIATQEFWQWAGGSAIMEWWSVPLAPSQLVFLYL